ncbi:MAG: hypothetical protein ACYDEX_20205 [Mobilitalea sp.]
MNMRNLGWEQSEETVNLRKQISEYVVKIISGNIPQIPFGGYQQFIKHGSRKEFEDTYFEVRKQLTALGLYLQWNHPSCKEGFGSTEKERVYFNELLWSVSNEFSWCLAAHLNYNENSFNGEPEKHIDLFAAETAATLSELLVLHSDKIDLLLQTHIRKQINKRVLTPFLEQEWGWETSTNNWCAVCSGSIGMAALLLQEGERKKEILDKVERALVFYLKCFGEDGGTEEGIGYWVYGFGYYIYYTAMRMELDSDYYLSDEIINKIKKIAEFPINVQMAENTFVPFSDASSDTRIPTGLISYLFKEYGAKPPLCTEITPFDYDHCYRFAHISRNLWWTNKEIFNKSKSNTVMYYPNTQWLLQRKGACFFAAKGGNNMEEHNHNDVGSFVLAIDGELMLADLGAGTYTAEYFGDKRYQYPHTRSYWHNLPLIQGMEQKPTQNQCKVEEVVTEKDVVGITMELSMLYLISELQSFQRKIKTNMVDHTVVLQDYFKAKEEIEIEEGFISIAEPKELEEGVILWKGKNGNVTLYYDSTIMDYLIDEKVLYNHLNKQERFYRLGLRMKTKVKKLLVSFQFSYEVGD